MVLFMCEDFFEYLKFCINEKKLPHAFLLESNNYDVIINRIFDVFLDNNLISSQKCIDNNISVRVIRPIDGMIDKDSILDIQNFVFTTSFCDGYKVYFIVDAGLMNNSAVNKILKILEEPCSDSIGFLICDNSNVILPTVLSRCQVFNCRDNEKLVSVDKELFSELCNFCSFSFEDYISFKLKVVKMEKVEIIALFENYLKYLYGNNDLFYLKVNDFIEKLRYNINVDLFLDKLYMEICR